MTRWPHQWPPSNTVEKKHNESSKIFADFTLSRIQPEIRQSFTDVQLIELRRVLIDQVESSHHSLDLRFTVNFYFGKYYFVILGGKDRRKKTVDQQNTRKQKVTEKILTVVLSISFLLLLGYFLTQLAIILYEIKSQLGIDIFKYQHAQEIIQMIIDAIL